MALGEGMPVVDLALEVKGWNILTAYPLLLHTTPSSTSTTDPKTATSIAILGLLGKLTGACAVVGTPALEQQPNGSLKIVTTLKALGVLGVYISNLPGLGEWEDHVLVMIRDRAVPVGTVKVADANEKVLEIDVEAAWKEMGLVAGWGREVEVVVMVH